MAAALILSCSEKPVQPDDPGTPGTEEVPVEPEPKPEPEPGPEPGPEPEKEIKPMLDLVFNAD